MDPDSSPRCSTRSPTATRVHQGEPVLRPGASRACRAPGLRQRRPVLPHEGRVGLLEPLRPAERLHGDPPRRPRARAARPRRPALRVRERPADLAEHRSSAARSTSPSRPVYGNEVSGMRLGPSAPHRCGGSSTASGAGSGGSTCCSPSHRSRCCSSRARAHRLRSCSSASGCSTNARPAGGDRRLGHPLRRSAPLRHPHAAVRDAPRHPGPDEQPAHLRAEGHQRPARSPPEPVTSRATSGYIRQRPPRGEGG